MSDVALFELLAAVCALLAALFVFDQYLNRPRPYKLLWTLGLLFYGIAAAAAWAGALNSWTVTEYKLWYFFGGVLTAAYLGLGSFFLLGPRRLASILTVIAALVSLAAAVRIFTYPVPGTLARTMATLDTAGVTNTRQFPVLPRDLVFAAIAMNVPGALFLFGGAAWSAWTFWRQRTPGYRVVSMALLALGAVFPSVLTGLQRLGYSGGAALGEFLGALCLLAGLLVSLEVFTTLRVPFTPIVLRERVRPTGPAGAPHNATADANSGH
ncbi:MAG: hypothetical protein IVW57_09025 [Ktedonobacterales bacterium]|nr:hypothetical protein [Ktedonobacterales bacterium]